MSPRLSSYLSMAIVGSSMFIAVAVVVAQSGSGCPHTVAWPVVCGLTYDCYQPSNREEGCKGTDRQPYQVPLQCASKAGSNRKCEFDPDYDYACGKTCKCVPSVLDNRCVPQVTECEFSYTDGSYYDVSCD